MSHLLSKGRVTRFIVCLTVVFGASVVPSTGPSANAQDLIGGFLGPVIEAGAGEVLNRAGGQILEGALNGQGTRRQLPFSGRRRSRRSGNSQPVPMRSSPPVREYVQPGTIYPQSGSDQSVVRPGQPQVDVESERGMPTAPPANEIPVSQRLQANASPLDLALTHVLEDGPLLAARVFQAEAEGVSKILDDAVIRQLRRSGRTNRIVSEYQSAIQAVDSIAARNEWNARHLNVVADDRSGIELAVESALSVSSLASFGSELSFADRQKQLDELRAQLTRIPASVVGSDDLSLLAERVRNMRNISLLAELARLTGIERRQDLFMRVHQAAAKSNAPSEFVALISGFALPGRIAPVPHASVDSMAPSVALHHPLTIQVPVNFSVENIGELTLEPGSTAAGEQSVVVRFDNGKGVTKRYTLDEGFFQWKIKDGGWDIGKKTVVKFVVDASQSRLPFHYLLNGEPMLVEPGETAEHSSNFPPRIDFDRGLGDGTVATKILNPGRFAVMVNPETGAFDLYPADQESIDEPVTTRQRALRAWRDSVGHAQRHAHADLLDPLDQTLNSILNEIE